MRRILTTLMLMACAGSMYAQDSAGVTFNGDVAVEVNLGHESDAHPHRIYDFPHITFSGSLSLPHGWSIEAELEYERMYEDGAWSNNFVDNYMTNILYANKRFSDALELKAGIIDVPVGLTNARGSALTIYDPLSEVALLPIQWHDGGVALHGTLGRFRYEGGFTLYAHLPLNESKLLGAHGRMEYRPVDQEDNFMHFALSSYWGTSNRGMIAFNQPDFYDGTGIFYASADYDIAHSGLISDGSLVYCSDGHARSAGAEIGYNILESAKTSVVLIPFVRYDGVWMETEEKSITNQYTVGMNIGLFNVLILKAQHAWRHSPREQTRRRWDLSIGFEI